MTLDQSRVVQWHQEATAVCQDIERYSLAHPAVVNLLANLIIQVVYLGIQVEKLKAEGGQDSPERSA